MLVVGGAVSKSTGGGGEVGREKGGGVSRAACSCRRRRCRTDEDRPDCRLGGNGKLAGLSALVWLAEEGVVGGSGPSW